MFGLRDLFARRYRSVLYEVTQRCNHNCLYCYNVWKNGHPYPSGELSTAEAKNVLAKAVRESRCRLVTLTGGEPLLRDDIPELIAFLKSLGVGINLITNGSLLTESTTRACIEAGVTLFELPLLSARKEVHNALTRSDSFDAVIEAVANIRSLGGKVVTVFVATKKNIADLKDTIGLNVGLSVDAIMLNRFNPGGEGARHIAELLPSKEKLEDALAVADSASQKFGLPIACSIPIQPCLIDTKKYKRLSFGFCSIGTRNAYFTIDSIGNLRPCNHSPLILGSLLRESFTALTRKPEVRQFAAAIPPSCAPCRLSRTCQGGCKAAAEVCYGSIHREEPFLAACVSRARLED